jgi:hypothetical protein
MVDAWPDTPYALDDDDRLQAALTAPRGLRFRCPSCACALTLQRRPDLPATFRHPVPTPCHERAVARAAARHLLGEQLRDELRERDAVVLHRPCPGSGDGCPDGAVLECWRELPGWQRIEIETHGAPGGPDVVVRGTDAALIGFVLVTAVDACPVSAVSATAPIEQLSIEGVLSYGPREPLGEGERPRCTACDRAPTEGREGIGWDDAWRSVMAAAGADRKR